MRKRRRLGRQAGDREGERERIVAHVPSRDVLADRFVVAVKSL